jgi:hypothetical protein
MQHFNSAQFLEIYSKNNHLISKNYETNWIKLVTSESRTFVFRVYLDYESIYSGTNNL